MKPITRILMTVIALTPLGAVATPVPTTMGDNLTAYNPGSGALNNNTWATTTNSRSTSGGASAPVADFGNCNSLILRCATPKCTGGGCADMTVAETIVRGCVQSSDTCKKHGDDLVKYIAAQLVADSAAAANAANTAAANAAAQQSAQQMAAMQQQMQQMQADMAAQNQQQMAAMQAALDEQKQIAAAAQAQAQVTANAAAAANAAAQSSATELSDAQKVAASTGVSADLLVREQIGGEIMTKIEAAEIQLKKLEKSMDLVFEYAGCDSTGNNCSGPKRISKFKKLAREFFDPYENVTDEIYDALIDAMSIGVDITDVMMLLNNSCNRWGEYWCRHGQDTTYTEATCINGRSVPRMNGGGPFGGHNCTPGGMIPESDNGCRLVRLYSENEDVTRAMLYGEEEMGESGATMRVACAADVLFSSALFKKKAKPATIDIDVLSRMISQDEGRITTTSRANRNRNSNPQEVFKYCAIDEEMYSDLLDYVARRSLPTKRLCVDDSRLDRDFDNMIPIVDTSGDSLAARAREMCSEKYHGAIFSDITRGCYCEEDTEKSSKKYWFGGNDGCRVLKDGEKANDKKICCKPAETVRAVVNAHKSRCHNFGDALWSDSVSVNALSEIDNITVSGNDAATKSKKAHLGVCNCSADNNYATAVYNCCETFNKGITIINSDNNENDISYDPAPQTCADPTVGGRASSGKCSEQKTRTACDNAGCHWHVHDGCGFCWNERLSSTEEKLYGAEIKKEGKCALDSSLLSEFGISIGKRN